MDSAKRIMKEMYGLCRNPPEGFSAQLSENPLEDVVHLTMLGPSGTAYEGGLFRLTIQFSGEYPYEAPIVKFHTPIYHPNVSSRGHICASLLGENWAPSVTPVEILCYIRSMLKNPQIDYFLNVASAFEYQFEKTIFNEKARDWTRRFAQPISSKDMGKILERISLCEKDQEAR